MVGETWKRSAARRRGQLSSTTQRARRRRPVSVRGALRWTTRAFLVGVDVAIHTEPGRPSPIQDPSAEIWLTRPQPPRTEHLGALLRLDALLGTHHADHFMEPDGLWDEWVKGVRRLGYPSHTSAEQRRWTDLQCDFTNGWSRA
ncbi:DUF6000 family protein [Streptomyces sp. NPDC057509]|uniref:DUF6000 family protein n=1 Tax=Streptomyces sp. NPDC057509 TaxID=3346152 RepID=UPI00368D524E